MRKTLLAPVLAALVVLATSMDLAARRASPTVLMVHGGNLKAPVFIVHRGMSDVSKYRSFWCANSRGLQAEQLKDRPFYNVSAFWGLYPLPDEQGVAALLKGLKADQAHQQGRLYVASGDVGAAAVSTEYMEFDRNGAAPGFMLVRPVPANTSGFMYGTWLSDEDVAAAEQLGIKLRR